MKSLSLSLVMTVSLSCLSDFALAADLQPGLPLVINELMASNSSTIKDPQGQYDDWIEIYNFGHAAINMGGMYLTDDLADPTKWQIPTDRPSDTTIPAHGYVLIWADKDTADAGLHANFKLDGSGEELGLFDISSSEMDGVTLVDYLVFAEQTVDSSFGRYPDAGDKLSFLVSPTPGAKNTEVYLGQVRAPECSHLHGFFNEPFSVTLTTETAGATIYYTVDGSEPYGTETGGRLPSGIRYADPILINKTTCLRAKALKEDWKSSTTSACTYLFLDDVLQQPVHPEGFPTRWGSRSADYEMDPGIVYDARYHDSMKNALMSIPSMSLVMNQQHMFGAEGVYANPNAEREKPTSIELIYPDGAQEGFQVNCGIKIIGGASRNMSLKNSFRLLFKGVYGPAKLRFPLFGPDAAREFNTIVLRSSFNDGYGWSGARYHEQYTRDEFIRTLQRAMGHVSPNNTSVHLYINGLYWGLYFPCERPDASFSASYYGGEEEDWDTFSHRGISLREGNDAALDQMTALCQQASHSDAAYQQLQGNHPDGSRNPDYPCLLDVMNYIDYLILNYCVNNEDWPWNNYWFARKRSADSTGFKFYSWDSEISLYLPPRAHMELDRTRDYRNVGQFHGHLVQNDEYRLFFADRVHHHLFNNGVLTPDVMSRLYADIASQVEMPVMCESARWGDMHYSTPLNQDDWYEARDWLLGNFFQQRHDIVWQQLKNVGLYPEVETPTFYVNEVYQHGGHVDQPATLTLASPSGAIYYSLDGTDPRDGDLKTLPLDELVTEDMAKKLLIPTEDIGTAWRQDIDYDDSAWDSGAGGIGFDLGWTYAEYIDWDILDAMWLVNASCYIRIPFTLNNPQEIQRLLLKIRYDDGFAAYLNGEQVILANTLENPAWNDHALYAHESDEAFETFSLSDYAHLLQAGENLLAVHGLNASTSSPDFLLSLRLLAARDIQQDTGQYVFPIPLTKSTQIKAAAYQDGQWSALHEATFALGPVADNLRITEIMYHPQDTGDPKDPNGEFIELTNIGTETLHLNLVKFTRGIDFTFPDIDLAAGQYVVIVKDRQAFAARYGTDINIAGQYSGRLANGGERIRLEDAVGHTILDFEYSDDWYRTTDGRGYSLTIIDAAHPDPDSWSQKQSWRATVTTLVSF